MKVALCQINPTVGALSDNVRKIIVIKASNVKNKFLSQIPTGKIGYPKDIANTAIFLASDEAEYITGQTITVDGGRIIN